MASTRTGSEIADVITEIETGFQELRVKAEFFQSMRYSHNEYALWLFKSLDGKTEMDKRISERVPFPGGQVLDHAVWQTEAILNNDLSFHVPAKPGLSDRSDEQRRVDRLELFWAHVWGIKFDEGGQLRTKTHSGQAGDPFVPWWLEYDPFMLPEDEDKREQYRKDYWPLRLTVKDYRAIAFLADANGNPTIATLYEDIPYVELVNRYGEGKEKDKNALRICREQFPYLRGARGEAAELEESDLTRCRARVRVVDDGVKICHTIDISGTKYANKSGSTKYQMRDGETETVYDNYFGRPSLFPVIGRYNHSAVALEDRYLPLNDTLRRAQQLLDVCDTYIASIGFTPKTPTQSLPPEVAIDAMERGEIPDVDAVGSGIRSLFGQAGEMGVELNSQAIEVLRDRLLKDRDAMLPSPLLTRPDSVSVAYGTAAGVLSGVETSRQLYDNATRSEIGQILAVSKGIEHFFCESGAMAGSKKGMDKGQEKLYLNLRGDEPSKQNAMRYIAEHDTLLEVSPDDFHNDVIEIKVTASTQAQKNEEFQLKNNQAQLGYIPPEDVLETITSDVTGLKKKLAASQEYQKQKPAFSRAVTVAAIELIKLKGDADVAALFMPFVLPGDPNDPNAAQNGNGNGGSPPRPPNSMITQNTSSPVTNPSTAAVQG